MYETDGKTLLKAIEEYRKLYGNGEIDMFKLEKIIEGLKKKT